MIGSTGSYWVDGIDGMRRYVRRQRVSNEEFPSRPHPLRVSASGCFLVFRYPLVCKHPDDGGKRRENPTHPRTFLCFRSEWFELHTYVGKYHGNWVPMSRRETRRTFERCMAAKKDPLELRKLRRTLQCNNQGR